MPAAHHSHALRYRYGGRMNAKDEAEGLFKPKPAPESPKGEEARRTANMARLRGLRLAREKADREKDQAD